MDGYKCWKLAVRELYNLGYIKLDDLIIMYDKLYYDNTEYQNDPIYRHYYLLILDILRNKNLFNSLVKEDIDIITTNNLPDNKLLFKKMWISYILDCIEYGSIPSSQYNVYMQKITFDSDKWTETERLYAFDVIDKLRIGIINANPNAIDHMDYVSFNMLMHINEMEYTHD